MATSRTLLREPDQEILNGENFVRAHRPPVSTQAVQREVAPIPTQQPVLPAVESKPNEQLIAILKGELRGLKSHDRRTRYEMGKRLAAIQAERAKAKIGKFTTVDLKELKIPLHTAYRLIGFYKHVKARIDADLLQFAKDQKKFPAEDVTEFEQRIADAEVDALSRVIDEEAARIEGLKKHRKNQPRDCRFVMELSSAVQRDRFRRKWDGLDKQVRSKLVYEVVMNA